MTKGRESWGIEAMTRQICHPQNPSQSQSTFLFSFFIIIFILMMENLVYNIP
jgi:hypothetical protein